jgi:SAM-dependent methyltransferase
MDPGAQTLNGRCFVCNRKAKFLIDRPADGGEVNWRETLRCPNCGMINRWRGCLHLHDAICRPRRQDRIYLTERLSPVYEALAKRYPRLTASEYLPGKERGSESEWQGQRVRHEDVTQLSFADGSLDTVLCFDVLEHVPDYRSGLREFARVLDAGGQLVLSVPFNFQQETRVRAVVDDHGEIRHLVEPCYHGDPLSSEGVLSYYDFGMDLLEELRDAGFQEAFLVCYRSARWGYLQNNVAFIARKL